MIEIRDADTDRIYVTGYTDRTMALERLAWILDRKPDQEGPFVLSREAFGRRDEYVISRAFVLDYVHKKRLERDTPPEQWRFSSKPFRRAQPGELRTGAFAILCVVACMWAMGYGVYWGVSKRTASAFVSASTFLAR